MRAYYSDKVLNFLQSSDNEILGQLLIQHQFPNDLEQKRAWCEQIRILKQNLVDYPDATIYFEFAIPRMGKRVDNILILNGIIYLLEFKVFAKNYDSYAIEQVVDYSLDLKNFHLASHNKTIVPILVATLAPEFNNKVEFAEDGISNCIRANEFTLKNVLSDLNIKYKKENFDVSEWYDSSYKPTPTIVEAAQTLYANHSVEDISRHGADAINLTLTKNIVKKIIKDSKYNKQKSICFITGVPGAGKTLAGLDIATQSMNYEQDEHACFLSGNGPLVKVLREALIRNKAKLGNISKKQAEPQVHAFIQNIHHFRDEYFEEHSAPTEKVVIFDEAQRAWNKEQASKFMNKKYKIIDFDYSEPEFLISVMDRHQDWCVVICLIGDGQEINTGEAGLQEWFNTLVNKYPDWNVYCDKRVDYPKGVNIVIKEGLHLNVSLRSFKSAQLSDFIQNLIDNKPVEAKMIYHSLSEQYPIFITRDIKKAKSWVKSRARGTERMGLLAHSNALRLKPEGIFVKSEIDCANWFLNDITDIRSSYALEDCATEFDVQGLELDWTIVAWDANLRFNFGWEYMKFSGNSWRNINCEADKKYLLNSYRVLLTRARQGMVIFVPMGDENDETRKPMFYDGLYRYLRECGIKILEN
jgi:hypothetical protein fulcA4_09388